MKFTKDQLEADVYFLLNRSMQAGSCSFQENRDTGMSSNALVFFAYTGTRPSAWPMDKGDYDACIRAVDKLPEHRKTKDVLKMLGVASQKIA